LKIIRFLCIKIYNPWQSMSKKRKQKPIISCNTMAKEYSYLQRVPRPVINSIILSIQTF
jgi:hypothetical protein